MSDGTHEDERYGESGHDAGDAGIDDAPGSDTDDVHEDPPSYRSGRVRIIGAEPAGDTVREVTGPVADEHPDLLHWNDAPTGQVPAVLDRGTGEEQAVAPPTWREESTDWEAQEEVFEPAMLSDDLPAVGALLEERELDVDRAPWHFETDDTLVIPPEPGLEPTGGEPAGGVPDEHDLPTWSAAGTEVPGASERAPEPEPDVAIGIEPDLEPADAAPRTAASRPVSAAAAGAEATRLSPPAPPPPRKRSPRTTRAGANVRTGNVSTGGTGGRNMRMAIGTGVLLGIITLVCFALGTVATMFVVCLVVLLATAEAYAAFRRAQYHPATLLGLVAALSLLIETYNKGVAALPLVLVLLVAGAFIWYLARVEPAAEPVSGITSTVFVFVWVGAFGSFGALLLNPNLFPERHGIAFLFAAVLVTVTDDVASFLVGSAMGRHQLAPSISPNKSWEGLIGGAIAAVLVSVVVIHFIHPWTVSKAALYGLVVAVVAPLGDLSQSMIKRHLGIKDMGRILPGHGGILDRVDGLLFVVPATYFVVKALHLG
jgi:phosphatidate cytidylyltransferase